MDSTVLIEGRHSVKKNTAGFAKRAALVRETD